MVAVEPLFEQRLIHGRPAHCPAGDATHESNAGAARGRARFYYVASRGYRMLVQNCPPAACPAQFTCTRASKTISQPCLLRCAFHNLRTQRRTSLAPSYITGSAPRQCVLLSHVEPRRGTEKDIGQSHRCDSMEMRLAYTSAD